MSKFEEFMAGQSQPTALVPSMLVGGTFQCQICLEEVDEAEYYNTRKLLKWVCPEEHVSFLEDFRL